MELLVQPTLILLIVYCVSSIYMRASYEELGKELRKIGKNWEKLIKSEMHLSS